MHDQHPVGLVVLDDLHRNRLTVFFRLFLAIPQLIWFVLWSLLVLVLAVFAWFATLVLGRLPDGLHRFFGSYIRYSAHLTAYLTIVASPYPGFTGEAGSYPVDVRLPDPEPQPRLQVLFRLLLAIPALFFSVTLSGGGSFAASSSKGGGNTSTNASVTGLGVTIAVLGWFAALFTGRMPRGLRDAGAYSVGYRAQLGAYLLLLTPRYPNTDPTALLGDLERPPVHPVHIVGDSVDLRRSRLTVFFRLVLAVPHLIWLLLWSVVAVLASIVQWLLTLVLGRPVTPLHRFLSSYVRYTFHVYAFLFLVANPFPGFTGQPGTYPLDLELPEPGRQNRWKTAFRLLLAVPAFAVNDALTIVLVFASVLSWFASLFTGVAPEGLRNVSAYAVRYGGQANAYVLFVTDAYPHASPLEGAGPTEEHETQQVEQAA